MSSVQMKVELIPSTLTCDSVVASGTVVFDLGENEVDYYIGKAVYSFEKMGFNIDTHMAYTELSDAYKGMQLKKTFTKAADIAGLGKVSFKN